MSDEFQTLQLQVDSPEHSVGNSIKVGCTLAGAEEGGDNLPVVLLHGVGMRSAAWQPQIDCLRQRNPVIALDLPGHGSSEPIVKGASLSVFVDWLLAVIDELGLNRINLAGHSMGALIAAGFTVTHPERVARLALLNGVYRRDVSARLSVVQRAEQINSGSFDIHTPLNRWFGQSPGEQAVRSKVARWLTEVDIEGYATAYKAFALGDSTYADSFAHIGCPFLALTGSEDPNSLPAMSEVMAHTARNGTAVVIEGHKHMVNLTAPDLVNAALLDWLQTPLENMEVA